VVCDTAFRWRTFPRTTGQPVPDSGGRRISSPLNDLRSAGRLEMDVSDGGTGAGLAPNWTVADKDKTNGALRCGQAVKFHDARPSCRCGDREFDPRSEGQTPQFDTRQSAQVTDPPASGWRAMPRSQAINDRNHHTDRRLVFPYRAWFSGLDAPQQSKGGKDWTGCRQSSLRTARSNDQTRARATRRTFANEDYGTRSGSRSTSDPDSCGSADANQRLLAGQSL